MMLMKLLTLPALVALVLPPSAVHGTDDEDMQADVEETFAQIDLDGDGFITKEELREFLGNEAKENDGEMTEEEFQESLTIFEEGDKNGDGKISKEELIQMSSDGGIDEEDP